ncbi:MAG: DUF1178 family protein [Betaproteobacteria bacterium]
MIVYDLRCAEGHRFEGWFGSAKDFASQRKRGLLGCPTCGAGSIERALSAPRINVGAQAPSTPAVAPEMEGKDPFAIAQILYSRMLDEVLKSSEDVGKAFPAEARKMYYSEVPARPIRGQASDEEHAALVDEGIPVARIPVPPSGKMN